VRGSILLGVCSRGKRLDIWPDFYIWSAAIRRSFVNAKQLRVGGNFDITLCRLHEKHALRRHFGHKC